MKTLKFTSINISGLKESKNFETVVSRLINGSLVSNNLEKRNEIYISDGGMKRSNGYGQYKMYVDMTLDGHEFNLQVHSTDSVLWDDLNGEINETKRSNILKRIVINVLEKNIEKIVDDIYHENQLD